MSLHQVSLGDGDDSTRKEITEVRSKKAEPLTVEPLYRRIGKMKRKYYYAIERRDQCPSQSRSKEKEEEENQNYAS